MDIERGSLCPEKRSNAVRGGRAACSAVRCAFRFVTAANRGLSSPSGGGDDDEVSAFSVFVSAAPVRFWFSAFAVPATLSVPAALGVIPVTN